MKQLFAWASQDFFGNIDKLRRSNFCYTQESMAIRFLYPVESHMKKSSSLWRFAAIWLFTLVPVKKRPCLLLVSKSYIIENINCCGYFTGWWLGHPSEKYESIGMTATQDFWENAKFMATSSHQPEYIWRYPVYLHSASSLYWRHHDIRGAVLMATVLRERTSMAWRWGLRERQKLTSQIIQCPKSVPHKKIQEAGV